MSVGCVLCFVCVCVGVYVCVCVVWFVRVCLCLSLYLTPLSRYLCGRTVVFKNTKYLAKSTMRPFRDTMHAHHWCEVSRKETWGYCRCGWCCLLVHVLGWTCGQHRWFRPCFWRPTGKFPLSSSSFPSKKLCNCCVCVFRPVLHV